MGIIFLISLCSFCLVAETAADGQLFFPDLFEGFETEAELKQDKSGSVAAKIKEGNFYFIEGTSFSKKDSRKKKYLEKAKDIFEKLWRKDRSNPKLMMLMAYSYTAICDVETNLEKILKYVFRARNYFTIVIQKLENNLDARLGRVRININLTPQNGRPDDMLLEDSLVFIKNYELLDEKNKQDEYFLAGLAESYLGAAVIYDYRRMKNEAKEVFLKIDKTLVPPHLNKLYQILQRKYGK